MAPSLASYPVKLHSYSMTTSTQSITKMLHIVSQVQGKLTDLSATSTYPLMMSGPHLPPWILVKLLGLTISIPRFLSTVLATSLSEPIHHLFCQSITHGQLRTFRVENSSYHTNFQI